MNRNNYDIKIDEQNCKNIFLDLTNRLFEKRLINKKDKIKLINIINDDVFMQKKSMDR